MIELRRVTRMARLDDGLGRHVASRLWVLTAVGVGSGLSHVATTGMPFQVGALMDGTGMTASEAGLFAFCQVGGLSVAMIAVAALTDTLRPRWLALAGALLALVADAGLFFARGYHGALLLGGLAGFGFGLVFTATIAGAAASRDADRVYAIGLGGALLIVTGVMAVLPLATVHWGAMSVFLVLSLLCLVSTPSFFGFSPYATVERSPGKIWQVVGARGLLFGWAFFSMGTSTVYVFAERIGKAIPLAPLDVGFILSTGVIVGVGGTALAAYFSRRMNRRLALIVGLTGSGLSCLTLGLADSYATFAVGVYLFWVFTMFLYCFLLGSAAILDESGRLGSLGGGMERLGYAVGAWIGGVVADHSSFSVTGSLACGMCFCGLAFGYPSLFRALSLKRSVSVVNPS